MAKKTKSGIQKLKQFTKSLKDAADSNLKTQYALWLEGLGMEFLGIVQDEIIRLKVVDTRRLLNSFSRGSSDCAFEIDANGLKLTVGTNVEYAAWVNDGHWVESGEQEITGYWSVNTNWWEGYHYFDIAIAIFSKIAIASLDRRFQKWLGELGGE